jgi:hypothetical protein
MQAWMARTHFVLLLAVLVGINSSWYPSSVTLSLTRPTAQTRRPTYPHLLQSPVVLKAKSCTSVRKHCAMLCITVLLLQQTVTTYHAYRAAHTIAVPLTKSTLRMLQYTAVEFALICNLPLLGLHMRMHCIHIQGMYMHWTRHMQQGPLSCAVVALQMLWC